MTDADVLAAERRRAREPRAPPAGVTWRPTPTRAENNRTAANSSDIVMVKTWDGSPIQADQSWDPTPPPLPVLPPVNLTAPTIVSLAGLEVGDQVVGQQGTWSGGPTIARQWLRDGTPIAGENGAGYMLVVADIGAMIGLTVVGTNPGGSASADADPVGPVVEAAPFLKT
jgi:hypothetical protein